MIVGAIPNGVDNTITGKDVLVGSPWIGVWDGANVVGNAVGEAAPAESPNK